MRLRDDQIREWLTGIKRYLMPLFLLMLPALLSIGAEHRFGDWAQVRVLLMFLSVLAGACWAFFLILSEQEGKGLLPDFHLRPFLDKARENALASAIVIVGFFWMFNTFISLVAGMISPR